MKKTFYFLIILILICSVSCDPNLFKDEEKKAPDVSEIFTSGNSNFTVIPGETVKFWVTATDPEGGTLSYSWGVNGGTMQSGTQSDTLVWRAPSVGGATYKLEVDVTNEFKTTSREEDLTVLAFSAPTVEIISPAENAFVVQYVPIVVSAEVIPNVQISEVQFFINDSLLDSKLAQIQDSTFYRFNWNVNTPAVQTEIKIKAIRVTNVSGTDSILVKVEGIVPGKN